MLSLEEKIVGVPEFTWPAAADGKFVWSQI
jgi:hypothetical protein